jgi:Zn-dependent M16 (insulinase) family peptidase
MHEFTVGDTLHGFTLVSTCDLPEQHGTGLRFRHDATGLDLFHICNDDPENLFSIMVKTPPKNDTGTPHIIEHAVLAGSRRFPEKEPFLSLMKGSANTFLNAMTYPDKTVYPAASPIKKDYFNLLSVYADAVFFPLLRRETFKQEGIRIKVDAKNRLDFDGIVFNEMKGAYSDHDSIVAEHSVRTLFPDTPYRFDSGGNPEIIPTLTYEEFKGFHAEFYHPSNCRIFLYGNIPTEQQLQFLESNYLKDFSSIKLSPEVGEPKPWAHPMRFEFTSPLSEGENPQGKSSITVNWWACNVTDPLDVLTLEVLTEALLGNPGAPLYKAIIESGFGTDIASISGMDADFKQVVFSLGITGSDREHAAAFEQLMLSELSSLVERGIDRSIVSQAIERIEFQQREIRGGIPNGLRVFLRSARGWLHGLAPSDTLEFTPVMERLKKLVLRSDSSDQKQASPGYLESWIERHLIGNNHRSLVLVRPDSSHNGIIEKRIGERLARIEQQMSKKEIKQLSEEQKKFIAYQQQPGETGHVPSLSREDLPTEIRKLDVHTTEISGVRLYQQKLFTNGITYIDLAFDLSVMTERQLMLMPLFSRLLTMTSLPGRDYDEISRMIAERTGGLHTRLDAGRSDPLSFFIVRMKTLTEKCGPALELVMDILKDAEMDNIRRMQDVIREMKSDYVSNVIQSGHAYASLRGASHLSPAASLEESWKGITQWFFLQNLPLDDTNALAEIGNELNGIRDRILNRELLSLQLTCDQEDAKQIENLLDTHISTLGSTPAERISAISLEGHEPHDEAFLMPSQVGYTALICRCHPFGSPQQVQQSVLVHLLKTSILWDSVRMLGGAYGTGASIDAIEELCSFSSYRDPRLADTFDDFRKAVLKAASGEFTSEDVERSLVSIVGNDLKPLSPGEKSFLGLRRALYGVTDEIRAERRRVLLETDKDSVMEAAAALGEHLKGPSSSVVLCSPAMLERDKKRLPGCSEHSRSLPL